MKKRALSICICLGITMALFAGCGSADQKKASMENTEAVQETGTEALSKLMDKDTEEATEVAEVTETTEASETSDPAASVDASAVSAEASDSGNNAVASGTAKADTKNKTAAKSRSKSDSGSASQASASQPAASGSGSAKADNTAAPAQPQQTTSAQPASQPQSAQPAHEHQWEQYVKDTINHPEVGHYETKVVQAAYDEPQYEWHYICNKCGLDMGTDEKLLADHDDVCDGSYRSDLVQVGSIHHDAVTEQVWVVDQAAYTENVYGYRCSCGATK